MSAATVVVTVYLPFTAVQVPAVTLTLAPAAMTPVGAVGVSVLTTAPVWSLIVTVTPCAAELDGWLPWFVTVVVNVTVCPPDG